MGRKAKIPSAKLIWNGFLHVTVRTLNSYEQTTNSGISRKAGPLFTRTTSQSPLLRETLATVAITRETREACFHLLRSKDIYVPPDTGKFHSCLLPCRRGEETSVVLLKYRLPDRSGRFPGTFTVLPNLCHSFPLTSIWTEREKKWV